MNIYFVVHDIIFVMSSAYVCRTPACLCSTDYELLLLPLLMLPLALRRRRIDSISLKTRR